MSKSNAKVAIMMGSTSDLEKMSKAADALKKLGIESETIVLSAHRAPNEVAEFSKSAMKKGFRAIIAGAGGAAHLPGVIAAHTTLPVIGVPIAIDPLRGEDSLLSIVQMPRGVPVGCVGIDNAWNAGLLVAEILAAGGKEADAELTKKLESYKEEMRQKVLNSAADAAS